jgi:3-hydroxybutyryl-CoA dehydratase
MKIGEFATREILITEEDVFTFAKLTGDNNPIHISEEYANNTIFKRRIVHGILVSGLISAILANDLPGEGTIYLKQELNFVKPVYIGSKVVGKVTVSELREDKPIAKLVTQCFVDNDIVIDGHAVVKYTKKSQ